MPGYIERALHRFQHIAPPKHEHAPHPWIRPNYGNTTQFAIAPDNAPSLNVLVDKTRILKVLCTLLFYAAESTPPRFSPLSANSPQNNHSAQATQTNMEKLSQ
jgi:hypothetical protein